MAPRPAWRGYLKLSLVTCAVELTNATTQSEKVRFRVINRATGNTVKRQYVDSATGKPVKDEDEVKGYETGDDEYLLIEEDEIEAVEIESSHTLNLEGFVSKSDIEQVYLDTPYYMTPADEVSEEAFAVIRDAMEDKKMAGLARIVLYRRERPVVIEPRDEGMLLTTLRYDKTVRQADDIFDGLKDVKLDKDMVDLAAGIIDRKKMKFDPSKFEDKYEDALMDLIEAKKKGKKPPTAKPSSQPSNVVNLFDALKKSLAEEGGGKEGGGKSSAGKRGKSSTRSDKKRTSA
ncbi:MAG: Ku protein [Rhizobiaceae bacterium]|jgi:DNA end-binding protein Ku